MSDDANRRELRLKVVYAGPGLSGKTTNLRVLHGSLPPERRGRLVSLSTQDDRTLFFDFMPLDIRNVGGHHLRLSVYSVPGQSIYRVSQLLILRDVDGLVFVADSHPFRKTANITSIEELRSSIVELGRSPDDIPIVFQYNKRDLPNRLPLDDLDAALNPRGAPFVPAVATEGKGVVQTLKEITRLAVRRAHPGPDRPASNVVPG